MLGLSHSFHDINGHPDGLGGAGFSVTSRSNLEASLQRNCETSVLDKNLKYPILTQILIQTFTQLGSQCAVK